MVPMLTCGFVRSNFAFATEAPPGCSATLVAGRFCLGYWPLADFDPG
jgi:hypothetical protein